MAEQKQNRSTATSVAGEVEAGLLSQLRVIGDIYWISPVRNRLILMILGVVQYHHRDFGGAGAAESMECSIL